METKPNITDFSHEILCEILQYLPLREILSVAMLCKKMSVAVDMHLKLCKSIDFCQDAICGYMPSTITDDHLLTLLKKCPHLETVYGLHPVKIERRRLRKRAALTIPGIIEALSLCFHLKAIETSDLRLFEAIMQHLPQLEIIGHFQNRDGLFPPQASQRLKLQPYPRISSLHLIGVEVPELTAMPHLQHLHLQCVRFTKLQPFRAFLAQNLKSFVMKHCIGPSVPQRYLSLIIALSSSPNLNHLELVRVPLLNGLFQRAVEDSYRHNGFVNLRTLVIAGCKGILEADLGHLMIVASKNLETLYIQPSLTKDSLFVSLSFAQCSFPRLQNLHLGYIDNLNSSGEWSNDTLLSFGLAEVPDTPSSITDSGMKVISQLFPHIGTLSVSNCPHLMVMYHWMSEEDLEAWSKLTDLTLQKCHCLQLSSFSLFMTYLPNIQVVILNDMFREPPKGCSHVGLSAGTGLGMSSAVVSNQDEHIAVQGHHQDFEHPGDEENEENEREFIDVENEDNPEPQFMVLQRDFFDGEDDDGADAPIEEGQDPSVLEQEQNIPENHPSNNNSPLNENNIIENSPKPSSSVNNKYSPSTSFDSENQNTGMNESKYHLRQTHKKLHSSDLKKTDSETMCKGKCCNSEEDVKVSAIPEVLDSNYVDDYDPHKPSTSKAGSHLDYLVTDDTKTCNISDSDSDIDYKYSVSTKRLKKLPDEQHFSKKVKKSTKNTENDVSIKTNCASKDSQNSSSVIKSNTCSYLDPNFDPSLDASSDASLDKQFKIINVCSEVSVTNSEENVQFYEPCISCQNNSNFKPEIEQLSSDEECKISHACDASKNSVNNQAEHSNFLNSDNDATRKSEYLKVCSPVVKTEDESSHSVDDCFNANSKTKLNSCETQTNKIQMLESASGTLTTKHEDHCHLNCSEITASSSHSSDKILGKSNVYEDSESVSEPVFIDYMHTTLKNQSCINRDASSTFCNLSQQNSFKEKDPDIQSDVSNDTNSEIVNNAVAYDTETSKSITSTRQPIRIFTDEVNGSSKIKPCYVLVSKIDDDPSYAKKFSSNQVKAPNRKFDVLPYDSIIKPVTYDISMKDCDKNSSRDPSDNLRMHDSYQPSTSKVGISNDIDPRKLSKSAKKKLAPKYPKDRKSPVNTRSRHSTPLITSSENEVQDKSTSELPIKSTTEKNNHIDSISNCDTDLSSPRIKRVKESCKVSHWGDGCDDHDSDYYILVPNNSYRSFEIINSLTGESYRTPCCHVSISPLKNENSSDKYKKTFSKKSKFKKGSNSKKNEQHSKITEEFNPYLPSTSKVRNSSHRISEDSNNVNDNLCQECLKNKGGTQKRLASTTVSSLKSKESSKFSNVVVKEEKELITESEGLKNKNYRICEDCCNHSVLPIVPSDTTAERLQIRNSDAAVFIKNCNTRGRRKLNPFAEMCCVCTSGAHDIKNNPVISCQNQEVKNESNTRSTISKIHSKIQKKDNAVLKSNDSSSSERRITRSLSCTGGKTKRKKIPSPHKQTKKHLDNSAVNSSYSCRHSIKSSSKRIPPVPMVSLISQGTQATSADIRRSVRRIRRATARRRTVPPVRVTRNSLHSSKISAKMLNKRPVSTNPRPESHDKATSTSDPLLEDDAVQTLQLASETLLSLTVVSCGLSDLIIDRCPRLFHTEVQACRILKKILLYECPALKKLNVSQCPKLNICALANAVMKFITNDPNLYFLVSYEPCMQGYHPGEGEKAILSRTPVNQSVLLCHDFCDISHDGIQAKFKDKILEWFRYLFKLHFDLDYTPEKRKRQKSEPYQTEENIQGEYPWSHDLRKIHGQYSYSSSDFCETEGRYQLMTNNPIFCDIFETNQLDTGFPDVTDCDAFRDISLISNEIIEKYFQMKKKFVGFYIPITENNQINF